MKTRSKENNQFKIDYAFPGLCSLCHDEVAEFNGSHPNGRPIITKLKNNYATTRVVLDDGSGMTITLCKNCKKDLSPDDMQELMESEINGWQDEVTKATATWTEEKKKSYMKKYSKKYIVDRVDKPFSLKEITKVKKPRKAKLKIKE